MRDRRDRRGRRRRGDRSNEPLPPLQRQPGAPVNAGAVHRAVLSGLVSSVGMRSDDGDYVGPKGMRFRIFPGSALFRQTPTWIVAAELVETTRLYARTVARIRADWIERVVPHLVRREVFEPHWLRDAGQVAAWEKVTFQGLVLIAKRRVPFGPIDPVAARDVFIQSALVEESIRTDGAFLAANRDLMARLEREEAKKRQRSVIVDLQARFAFYDARLPADVHSTPSFERWRRAAEARDPRLLHMRPEDLVHPGAKRPEAAAFPDHLEVAGMRFPLTYRHEPGDPEDGVTASVPIAALTQLPADRLEWLVPGLLREKVLALIRSLPKRLRVRFVPAPEYADGAVEALRFGEGSLPVRLAAHLARLSGTGVTASDFERSNVPEHLLLNLRLVDDAGRTVASGRDLAALQARFAPQSRAALQRAAIADSGGATGTSDAADAPPPVRHGIVQWDFGPLPARVELRRLGTVVPAFPALIDEGTSAGLHMMESPAAAETATRRGVRRLLSIALEAEIRPLLDYVPGPDGAAGLDPFVLLAAPLMTRHDLERDVIDLVVERSCLSGPEIVRSAEAFQRCLDEGRGRLWPAAGEVYVLVGGILRGWHEALLQLDQLGAAPPAGAERSLAEAREHLAHLMHPRVLADTPWAWLVHLPRYLRAALLRLRKLAAGGPQRDERMLAEIEPFAARLAAATGHAGATADPTRAAELDRCRWMLEEFRVSLFAQELGTAMPVSAKRLEATWTAAGV